MTTELFHTVLDLDLSQDDLYTRHQKIAAFVSRDADASRDFLFCALDHQVYLRAPQPRVNEQGWMAMPLPREDETYLATGTVWIDASRLPLAEREVWRVPVVLGRIVSRMLERAGEVRIRQVDPLPSLPLSKPGQPLLRITPISFAADLTVRNAGEAERVARSGIGRGKGFGFGCVFFQESSHA